MIWILWRGLSCRQAVQLCAPYDFTTTLRAQSCPRGKSISIAMVPTPPYGFSSLVCSTCKRLEESRSRVASLPPEPSRYDAKPGFPGDPSPSMGFRQTWQLGTSSRSSNSEYQKQAEVLEEELGRTRDLKKELAEKLAELPCIKKSDDKPRANVGFKSVTILNDLQAAIDVSFDEQVEVLYPKMKHTFQANSSTSRMVIDVNLRDDPSISGTHYHYCFPETGTSTLRVSESFDTFGTSAADFLRKEQQEILRHRKLRQQRQGTIQSIFDKEVLEQMDFMFRMLPMTCSLGLLCSGILMACVFAEPQDQTSALALSLTVVAMLSCVAGWCLLSGWIARQSVISLWVVVYGGSCVWFFLCSLFLIAAALRYMLAGFWWSALVAGLPCCFLSVLVALFYAQACISRERSEQDALNRIAGKTIVFHGSVLSGGGKCVASWPGKYESAWEDLVNHSRRGSISAAVVFLPEGDEHFGKHAPVPKEENLHGKCWCFPLYGEQKAWGCKWWTKWMENIDQAVEQGAELEVYFFQGMCGQGKAEHFQTVGQEHLQREAIYHKKYAFLKSREFHALEPGIQRLSPDRRADASSQYDREVHRRFLDWLPPEERKFLEASEGLGNSQKAEVAWLERKGYAYTEVDVSTWIDISSD